MVIDEWAARHGVAQVAVAELKHLMGVGYRAPYSAQGAGAKPRSEAAVSSKIRLDEAAKGTLLWRNNVGECVDKRGNHIRYGQCNESKAMNAKFKSSDYVGLRPTLITPAMIGHTFGLYVAIEAKKQGWVYTGAGREGPQLNFLNLVAAAGGHAKFSTGE